MLLDPPLSNPNIFFLWGVGVGVECLVYSLRGISEHYGQKIIKKIREL